MFGDEVKELRRLCGITQEDLGHRCGISASTIGMIEQGRRLPSPTLYARIQDTFFAYGYRLPPRPHKPTRRCDLFSLLRNPLDKEHRDAL